MFLAPSTVVILCLLRVVQLFILRVLSRRVHLLLRVCLAEFSSYCVLVTPSSPSCFIASFVSPSSVVIASFVAPSFTVVIASFVSPSLVVIASFVAPSLVVIASFVAPSSVVIGVCRAKFSCYCEFVALSLVAIASLSYRDQLFLRVCPALRRSPVYFASLSRRVYR